MILSIALAALISANAAELPGEAKDQFYGDVIASHETSRHVYIDTRAVSKTDLRRRLIKHCSGSGKLWIYGRASPVVCKLAKLRSGDGRIYGVDLIFEPRVETGEIFSFSPFPKKLWSIRSPTSGELKVATTLTKAIKETGLWNTDQVVVIVPHDKKQLFISLPYERVWNDEQHSDYVDHYAIFTKENSVWVQVDDIDGRPEFLADLDGDGIPEYKTVGTCDNSCVMFYKFAPLKLKHVVLSVNQDD